MYKYNANILPSSFDIFFSKLRSIHDHGTRQQRAENFHHKRVGTVCVKNCCSMLDPLSLLAQTLENCMKIKVEALGQRKQNCSTVCLVGHPGGSFTIFCHGLKLI